MSTGTVITTATKVRSLQQVLDEASPDEYADAVRVAKLGTVLAPLKRAFSGLTPAAAVDLTAVDAVGELAGPGNPNRLALRALRSLRVLAAGIMGTLSGGSDAVAASLDLSTKTVRVNTVIKAQVAGAAGNTYTIAFVSDGAGTGTLTLSGSDYTFHYATGVTTVANFEALITSSAHLAVKTPGTGANLVTATGDTFGAAHLASGADAVKASLHLSTLGSGALDTVVEASTAGAAGNSHTITILGDSPAGDGVTLLDATPNTTVHYEAGVSTVTNFETAIGTSTLLDVKTGGTGATVLQPSETPASGSYALSDADGTALDAAGALGLALLSDDQTTITFNSPVDAFTIEYVPQVVTDWQAAFPEPPPYNSARQDEYAPRFTGSDPDEGFL